MIATMNTELENLSKLTNFSPLYRQIKLHILDALKDGQWKPGDLIPSEVDLAARYQVSQGTVRKAIDELSAENFLVRRQGKGTFVSTHLEKKTQYRFLRLAADDGEPLQSSSKILSCTRETATADIALALHLSSHSEVIRIRRLLSFALQAVVLEDICLPADIFGGLSVELLATWRGPMYALFERQFDTHMVRASEKLKANAADVTTATSLGIKVGDPVLFIERISYTYGDKPVELRRAFYHTEKHHYLNELS